MGYLRFTNKNGQVLDSRGISHCRSFYERKGMSVSKSGQISFSGESTESVHQGSETDDNFYDTFKIHLDEHIGPQKKAKHFEITPGTLNPNYKPLPPYKKNKQAFWRAFNEMIKKALG